MRVRPTELGAKGLLLAAALALAYFATAYSNPFFLMLGCCGVLGVLGLWGTARNLAGVTVAIEQAPFAAAGARRALRLRLRAGRRRRFDLTVAIEVAGARHDVAHAPLLAGEAMLAADLPGLPRGVHTDAVLCVRSRFPFGLFAATVRRPAGVELVAHPAPAAAADREPAGERDEHAGALHGAATDLAGLRPFRAGDSPADVHWKASARRGAPIVKERERPAPRRWEIVLDRRVPAAALETALAAATHAVLAAAAAGRPAILRSHGAELTLDGGPEALTALLRWLAAAAPLPLDAPPSAAEAAGA